MTDTRSDQDRDTGKRQAAMAAVAMVEDGMVVGLGTGSTAAFAIDGLIARVRDEGLRIVGIPTSERSATQARQGGITLTDFASHPKVDLTIDGADEIARDSLDLIKGLGGALLREKIVAAASTRLVIIADEPKLVTSLGGTSPIPVEIVPFGWETTANRLTALGPTPPCAKQKTAPHSAPTAATSSWIATPASSPTRRNWNTTCPPP